MQNRTVGGNTVARELDEGSPCHHMLQPPDGASKPARASTPLADCSEVVHTSESTTVPHLMIIIIHDTLLPRKLDTTKTFSRVTSRQTLRTSVDLEKGSLFCFPLRHHITHLWSRASKP